MVQTNNATFGYTDESEQQFAISRLRAIEHGRSVVHVSTVGVSAPSSPPTARVTEQDRAVHGRRSASASPVVRARAATLADRVGDAPGVRRRGRAAPCSSSARHPRRAAERRGLQTQSPTEQTRNRRCLSHAAARAAAGPRRRSCIPTYNERENLPRDRAPGARGRARRRRAGARRQLARTAPVRSPTSSPPPTTAVHVLHRAGKEGLGAAYLAGFGWALERGYDALVEMDADGSHQPEQLPTLLDAARRTPTLVIGSRWVPGGSVVNWPLHRKVLSRRRQPLHPGAARHAGAATPPPASGSSAPTRCETIGLDDVASQGYCFQVDLTWRAVQAGPARRRGADHLRRARGRRLQDEPATS